MVVSYLLLDSFGDVWLYVAYGCAPSDYQDILFKSYDFMSLSSL